MTLDQLRRIMPYSAGQAETFLQPLCDAMQQFSISTAQRQSSFLAQVAHESGELRFVREIASGEGYEGRADLGNVEPGDGPRFKGRGLIQITGRSNYGACGRALNLNLLETPSLLEVPAAASRSAAWFWQSRGLNDLADADRFGETTKRINGGYTAIDARIAYWLRARKEFGL